MKPVRRLGGCSMNRILCIAVFVLTVAPLTVGQKQSTRRTQTERVVADIRKLDDERIQAQIHADKKELDRIYADDFIGVGPSGTVRTKPLVLADFTSGELNFQSITTDDVQIRIYGNTPPETGRSTVKQIGGTELPTLCSSRCKQRLTTKRMLLSSLETLLCSKRITRRAGNDQPGICQTCNKRLLLDRVKLESHRYALLLLSRVPETLPTNLFGRLKNYRSLTRSHFRLINF